MRTKRDESPIRDLRMQARRGSEMILSQLEARTRLGPLQPRNLSPVATPPLDATRRGLLGSPSLRPHTSSHSPAPRSSSSPHSPVSTAPRPVSKTLPRRRVSLALTPKVIVPPLALTHALPHRSQSLGSPAHHLMAKLDDPPPRDRRKGRSGWRGRLSRLAAFLRDPSRSRERRPVRRRGSGASSAQTAPQSPSGPTLDATDTYATVLGKALQRSASQPENGYSHKIFRPVPVPAPQAPTSLAEEDREIETRWRGRLEEWAGSLEEAIAVVGRESDIREEMSGMAREKAHLLNRLEAVASEREQWMARCSWLEGELRHKAAALDRAQRRTRSLDARKARQATQVPVRELEVLASPAALLCPPPPDPKTPPLWNPSSKSRSSQHQAPIRLELSQLLAQMHDLESQVEFLKQRRQSLTLGQA